MNYHIHTVHSDGENTIDEFVQKAIELGFNEIGFSEHLVILPSGDVGWESIRPDCLESYMKEVELLRKRNKRVISIKSGLEIEYFPETEVLIKTLISGLEFDYLMGSIHRLGDFQFDLTSFIPAWQAMKEDEIYEIYRRYFSALNPMIRSGLFDVVAHLDIIKKFGFRPARSPRDEVVEETINLISKEGLCLEVNASGLRHAVGEIYPQSEYLRMCRDRDIPITLGTDAHKIEHLESGLEELIKLIENMDYNEITLFDRQRRSYIAL